MIDIEEWAKTVAAIGGVLAAVWAVVYRLWSRIQSRRRMQQLEGKAVRYLLDAQRHTLRFVTPTAESRLVDPDQMVRQKALIDQVRDEIWRADGHGSECERESLADDMNRWLTRTQAIHLKIEKERQQ